MRFMGRPSAQNMHGGPDFRHILRKFAGLKEGVGENIPNKGRVIVSCEISLCYITHICSISLRCDPSWLFNGETKCR